jgi:hypothetical protein
LELLLHSRGDETEAGADELPPAGLADRHPVTLLAEDFERLNIEILALYSAELPPAVIHQISRGAREQALIGEMLLADCMMHAASGTLNAAHIANTEKWISGIRGWIEKRKAVYAFNCRRKLFAMRARR